MPTCIACKSEYATNNPRCPRCQADNANWEKERTRSGISGAGQFFLRSVWGILALTSLPLPILAILLLDFQPVASVRIGVALAIILCFVIFLFTYHLRFSAREYELLRRVRVGRPFGLSLLALLAFSGALVMALALAFTLEADEEALPTTGLTRVIMTLAFSMVFVNITLSAMLMAIRDFARRLDELVPQPVFLQEDHLVKIVLASACKNFKEGTNLELVEMSRTEDGGMKILAKDGSQPAQPPSAEADEETADVVVDQWAIEADRWGQNLSIKLVKPKEDKR
jgi:hypothetical protein